MKSLPIIRPFLVTSVLAFGWTYSRAQTADGNNGISQANTLIRGYFDTAILLMYAIGAILAVIGAIRVYQLWGSHNGEAMRAAAGWFGSCIFLVVAATIIRSFFGL